MADIASSEGICAQEVTYVEEADELLELVTRVPWAQGDQAATTAFNRYHTIVRLLLDMLSSWNARHLMLYCTSSRGPYAVPRQASRQYVACCLWLSATIDITLPAYNIKFMRCGAAKARHVVALCKSGADVSHAFCS